MIKTAVEHRTQQVQGLLLSTDSDVFLFAVRWAFEALIQVRFANCCDGGEVNGLIRLPLKLHRDNEREEERLLEGCD